MTSPRLVPALLAAVLVVLSTSVVVVQARQVPRATVAVRAASPPVSRSAEDARMGRGLRAQELAAIAERLTAAPPPVPEPEPEPEPPRLAMPSDGPITSKFGHR